MDTMKRSSVGGLIRLHHVPYWILGTFSFFSFLQSFSWLTFSSVPDASMLVFNISNSDIDLLLNWGPIIYIPSSFFISWLMNTTNGLRKTVLLGAVLLLAGAIIRALPFLLRSVSGPPLLHLAQILNAIAGAPAMALVSRLSAVWFPPNERTLSTAIATLSNSLGAALAFVIGPLAVTSLTKSGLSRLVYLELICSFVSSCLIFAYFPDKPSDSDNQEQGPLLLSSPFSSPSETHSGFSLVWHSIQELWKVCLNPSFFLLACAGGLQAGVFNGWTGVLPQILLPHGISPNQAGWLACSSTLAGVAAGLIASRLSDTIFRRRFRMVILFFFAAALSACFWFTLSLPSPMIHDALPTTPVLLMISIVLIGGCLGAATPVGYELGAELTYPFTEAVSANVIAILNNVGCLMFLFVSPNVDPIWMNTVLTGCICVSVVLLLFVKEKYLRSDDGGNESFYSHGIQNSKI